MAKTRQLIQLLGCSVLLSACTTMTIKDSRINDCDMSIYGKKEGAADCMTRQQVVAVPAPEPAHVHAMPTGTAPVPTYNSVWQAGPQNPYANHQVLTNYISRIAKELVANLQPYYLRSMAVTSFVNLDSTLQSSNLAGNQIAEEFITEMRQLGLPVVDFKTTGFIKVSQGGDFVFSRQARELREMQGIDHVLSGTMVWHQNGLVINARIIDLNSNQILAASKGFVPYFVADQAFSGPSQVRFHNYSAH